MKTNKKSIQSLLKVTVYGACLSLFLLAVSCSDSKQTPAADNVLFNNVSISSGQEVPANNSLASGTLAVTYDKNANKLNYTITYSGITPTAMHFHKGGLGVSGGVEIAVPAPYSSGMKGVLTLTDAQETDLLANGWYLNIHSDALPGGEIRGQVVTENFVVFSNIKLSGKQENPSNASTASGSFNGLYDKTTKQMTYTVSISGATAVAMHLHSSDGVGVNGDVVFPITGTSGTTPALTSAQETDLLAGKFYFNAHTSAYANGELRGQVVTDNVVIFASDISGANEVPATGTNATGSYYGAFNKTTNILSSVIVYTGVTPTAMHFHKGAAGASGAVVYAVAGPYSSGMKPTTTLTATDKADLFSAMWYLNIHSDANPGGEIRAQITK